jgi:flagellar biogenesis protein FliO
MIAQTRRRTFAAAYGLLFGLLATTQASAQKLGQATHYDPPWWRVIAALIFCVLLALAAAYVLRGRLNGRLATLLAPKAGERRLRLVETTRLSNQVDVCLLRIDDDELLLAVSPHGSVLLRSRPAAPAETAEAAE